MRHTDSSNPPSRSMTSVPAFDVSPDELLKYSNRWIANPALDLMAPEGTFVRGVTESMERISRGRGSGESAINDAGYPGFGALYKKYVFDILHQDRSSLSVWGRGQYGPGAPMVGTNYFEVIDTHRDGAMYTVVVCNYGSLTADDLGDGRFSSFGSDASKSSSAEILTFGPDPGLSADKQMAPKLDQQGPANIPTENVFGTWILTKVDPVGSADDSAACNKLAPGTPSDWPLGSHDHEYIRATPPPTLPPSPGWPK